ncbi:hypothetical protein EU803_00940 [Loktanella sp. IMCC34160]|uniref:hypothetical protein n=1 Tax=Rhodobacterales TaxID=204455 RepID=UPI00101BF9C1|nr:hypothetical protein [Loktanella sp. IMCC34160]RYG92704.1 hypothetical protein EU803_00940 [Loktanella sp. IMCC34160]
MSDFLPEAVRKGLEDARKAALRRSSRLCVHVDDKVYRVLRLWDGGFSTDAEDAPHLRGYVDLYDGMRHLSSCLVVASEQQGDEMVFEFKWNTAVSDRPAADFVREQDAPVALITAR